MHNKEYILSLMERLDIMFVNYKSTVNRGQLQDASQYEREVEYLITEITAQIEGQR